jgi:hypothetical protein
VESSRRRVLVFDLTGARAVEARNIDLCAAVANGEVRSVETREAACLLITAAAVASRDAAASKKLEEVGRAFFKGVPVAFSDAAAACSVRDFSRFRNMLEQRLSYSGRVRNAKLS